MKDVVQAYLEMTKMSILPLRSWSLIHEALTCSCVLALVQAPPTGSLVDSHLNKMQHLLEGDLQLGISESQPDPVGFISRGVRLLKLLREHSPEIVRAATVSQQAPLDAVQMATSEAQHMEAASGNDFDNEVSNALPGVPAVAVDSSVDQTWWEPLIVELGLDSSLSSFLDLSSDFFQ